jgi:hypothetical protein
MTTNNKETIEVLNDLIQINNDRIAGYEKAIKETKSEDEDLKVLYASMIAESHRNKIALASDVKAVFGGHDRHTILSNCEAGEDAAQRAYRTALENEAIPAFIRDLLTQQQQTLRESHDEIKSLRDQYA